MTFGRRAYGALAVAVVGMITAATAALLVAITLIARRPRDERTPRQ